MSVMVWFLLHSSFVYKDKNGDRMSEDKFEKLLKESFDSHLREARERNKNKPRHHYEKFSKFLFLDFHDVLHGEENVLLDNIATKTLESALQDPEPCFIAIVTAAGDDYRGIVEEFMETHFGDLFERFDGKFEIETCKDYSLNSHPTDEEMGEIKSNVISKMIQNHREDEDLQSTLVYFFDDKITNLEPVRDEVDKLNISIDNIIQIK